MEMLARIEDACRGNNHTSVRQGLDTIESHDLKKKAFLKIIDYYEKEEGQFPVGYVFLFIEWLLKQKEHDEAGNYIEELYGMGVGRERISRVIYEHIIQLDEAEYEERFHRNLEILTKNRALFSRHPFDFHEIKKKVVHIKNCQTHPEDISGVLTAERSSFLLVDLIDMELIQRVLSSDNYLYLVYDDLDKFHYMLLFEDLLAIRRHIEAVPTDRVENVIFFAGRDLDTFRGFFSSMLTVLPHYVIVRREHNEYRDIMKEMVYQREERVAAYHQGIEAFYKNRDHAYYQDLFLRRPSDIKVLVITSLSTTLNQHIAKGWYSSFVSLGYTTELLIEQENYERPHNNYIAQRIYEFKPDIVFNINHTVNGFSEESAVKNTLLWIMRHRDYNDINFGDFDYQDENMFVLPLFWEFIEASRERNIPDERICYTPEGVDLTVFAKSGGMNMEYACDVVSVNNAVGNEAVVLEFFLQKTDNTQLRDVMRELYGHVKEMADDDRFLTKEEFLRLSYEKSSARGSEITVAGRQFLVWFYFGITDALYRKSVMNWIVDSHITNDIKVWGGSWSRVEKFRKYHMGTARHGRQLCEIYRSSRISLSDSWAWNTHDRNYEIMASGGFPLTRYIKVEAGRQMDVITNYFREDEEVVLFYGRDDLLNKIQYYLDNPGERDRIAEKGRNVAVRKFSNIAIAEKTMAFIRDYYRKRLPAAGPSQERKE